MNSLTICDSGAFRGRSNKLRNAIRGSSGIMTNPGVGREANKELSMMPMPAPWRTSASAVDDVEISIAKLSAG